MLDGSEGAKDEFAVLSDGPGGKRESEREHNAFKKGIQTLQYLKAK